MPCLQELVGMLGHEPFQATKFVSPEPTRRRQGYRLQPELGNGGGLLHVDVGWLGTLPKAARFIGWLGDA